MAGRLLTIAFFILSINVGLTQPTDRTINFHTILENLVSENRRPLVLRNYRINHVLKPESVKKHLLDKFGPGILNENGQIILLRDLVISNCQVDNDIEFSDFEFKKSLNIYNTSSHDIILNGKFNKITLSNNQVHIIRILYSEISGEISLMKNTGNNIKLLHNTFLNKIELSDNELDNSIRIFQNDFNPTPGFVCPDVIDSVFYGREFLHNVQMDIESHANIRVEINENFFLADEKLQRINIRGHISDLIFENNIVQSTLDLTSLAIDNRFVLVDNKIEGYISFNDLIFPEIFNLVRWDQIGGYKIIVFNKIKTSNLSTWTKLVECNPKIMAIADKEEKFIVPYFGSNQMELSDKNAYEKLIYSYKSLYNIYTTRGDLEAANACYAEMKEIQRRRLKHIYTMQGGFKNYFRWQLNILLKVYTNHGTDPALAMLISVYVILFFGLIYFFYPSEWDVSSKSQLLKNYKEFIQKNEKGYLKPFLVVLKGFIFSMINALTLSLNSFITLGFGNIPTKGLARYACIVEGFIGWFLLSIFTVAMINQVLA